MNVSEEQGNAFETESARIVGILEAELARIAAPAYPEALYEAIGYSLLAPGKRIRPLLVFAACAACGGTEADALPFACAVEMIHAYSLIHDDLPALDNDDLRRGRPTSHIRFGEAMAILAGDALLNMAYEAMAAFCEASGATGHIRAMRRVADAAGAHGMVGGQVVDVIYENKTADEQTLLYIHRNKTGKLLRAALCAGAAAAGADAETLAKYDELGDALGLAFQIQDDILDVISDAASLGKPVHSDEKNQKNTAVSLYGLTAAQARYAALCTRIDGIATALPNARAFLQPLLSSIAKRLK